MFPPPVPHFPPKYTICGYHNITTSCTRQEQLTGIIRIRGNQHIGVGDLTPFCASLCILLLLQVKPPPKGQADAQSHLYYWGPLSQPLAVKSGYAELCHVITWQDT